MSTSNAPNLYYCQKKKSTLPLKTALQWPHHVVYQSRVSYTFAHLARTWIRLSKPAVPGKFAAVDIDIEVIFDCHVSTEEIPQVAALHDSDLYWNDDGGHLREFCEQRYLKSYDLLKLIKEAANGPRPCYRTKRDNALIWEMKSTNLSLPSDYYIFFQLRPTSAINAGVHALRMYIQTAYLKQNPDIPASHRRERLITLCLEELYGKEEKREEKKKRKNRGGKN